MLWIVYIFAGLGAAIVTGLAGLSAAVVITPLLVSVCGWASYDAVTDEALVKEMLKCKNKCVIVFKDKSNQHPLMHLLPVPSVGDGNMIIIS